MTHRAHKVDIATITGLNRVGKVGLMIGKKAEILEKTISMKSHVETTATGEEALGIVGVETIGVGVIRVKVDQTIDSRQGVMINIIIIEITMKELIKETMTEMIKEAMKDMIKEEMKDMTREAMEYMINKEAMEGARSDLD